jgi:hypothetical protein
MKLFRKLAAGAVALSAIVGPLALTSSSTAATAATTAATDLAAKGATAVDPNIGYVVYDRQTGLTTESNGTAQFRSASVVKLLIALDYLESRGAGTPIPAADAGLLKTMLRSSDDNAASTLWTRGGSTAIVTRMVARIGLPHTAPPANAGMWGYTAISAADTVKIYRYILDLAQPAFRDLIMGHLHQSTKCATDGRDQSFGIPSATSGPWSAKQGWSGFGTVPGNQICTGAPAAPTAAQGTRKPQGTPKAHRTPEIPGTPNSPNPLGAPHTAGTPGTTVAGAPPAVNAIDLTSPALHTTGTICQSDRKVVAVLSLYPAGTSWTTAASRLTSLTAGLTSAAGCGGTPNPTPVKYYVTTFAAAEGNSCAPDGTACRVDGTLNKGLNYVYCKAWGANVSNSPGAFNHWWLSTDLDTVVPGGRGRSWVSAYYLAKWGNDEAKDDSGRVIPDCGALPTGPPKV